MWISYDTTSKYHTCTLQCFLLSKWFIMCHISHRNYINHHAFFYNYIYDKDSIIHAQYKFNPKHRTWPWKHTNDYDVYEGNTLLLYTTCIYKIAHSGKSYIYRRFGDKLFFSGVPLNTFMDDIEADIWNIIKLSLVKSWELDHLPTWLLKECIAELVALITDIVNTSLRESMIPKSPKTVLIRPLMKKTGLDSDILKNYDPVSN